MKQRNPLAVFLLPIVTFGIYTWYWLVKTKGEMNSRGEEIPTAWIWLIPFVGTIWWLWKYSEGVEHVTGEKMSGVMAFVLIFLLGNIGTAIIQNTFNEAAAVPAAGVPGYVPPMSPDNQPQPISQPVEQAATFAPAAEAPVQDAYVEPVAEPSVASDNQSSEQS